MAEVRQGKVYLVGAGPGRAELITLRGAEALRCADCIIYDRLVNPDLLGLARADAEIIHTPKRAGGDSATQEQINRLLLEKASAGRIVVRLKGGDACIFGRGFEEAALLAEAGIEFEIVPGVTAAVAASEYAGIMLTDRACSSQVVFVTGKEAEGKEESNIDWPLLAKFPGTIVFYMGMSNLEFIVEQLMRNGMSGETPAAAVAQATLPRQRKVHTTVADLPAECKRQDIEAPAIIVIGAAAKANNKLEWFSRLALFGRRVVTTRDKKGNAEFAAKITASGGQAVRFDGIEIKSLTEKNEFLQTPGLLRRYDWVIFTSANAVRFVFDCLNRLGKDARVFSSARIAAIGRQTARTLAEYAIVADFVPMVYTSAGLGRELIAAAELKSKNVLLFRSAQADDQLKEALTAAGANVEQSSVYTVGKRKCDCSRITEMLTAGQIEWVSFASPSAVESFFEQISAELVSSGRVRIASIGPVTSSRLMQLGQNIDAEAGEHTIDGLLDVIKNASQKRQ